MGIFLIVLHFMICLVLVVTVLVQHGKGADIGAVFGGGGSNTVFGSRGAGNFLTKVTTGAAIAFMLSCVALGYRINQEANRNIFENVGDPSAPNAETLDDGAEDALGGFEEIPAAVPEPRADVPAPSGPEVGEAAETPAVTSPGTGATETEQGEAAERGP